MAEKTQGRDHSDVPRNLNNMALLYEAQGRYAEAEPLLTRALAIDEKAFGPDHRNVATVLNNLAALYDTQGRYAEAKELAEHALNAARSRAQKGHPTSGVVWQLLKTIRSLRMRGSGGGAPPD